MTETTTTTDPPHIQQLPAPTISTRFLHVAARSPAEMTWSMDQINARIKTLEATIISIAHAIAASGAGNPPLYSLVIAYSCPAWSPPLPPIPPYPGT